jgi:hypothetical protein
MHSGCQTIATQSGSKSVPQLAAIGVDDAPVIANAKQHLARVGIDDPTVITNPKHQLARVGVDDSRATYPKDGLS